LLTRIWEIDNEKPAVLWELGNQGGVSGDVFVKVAYDPEWTDDIGVPHPGRVRILPLNSAFCFPEYHPHDRSRLIRFKLKYRFWGTAAEGTRQVYTYTEIITDQAIEEYVNDELIDSRPNPLGTIPISHIQNVPVSGSPWGLSDIGDIISLNREYNEKATDISDIINYHAAPVTIITGAKASNLERGPRKVWGGLPEKANVFNLENGVNLAGPIEYLELIKRAMHEMTGVPESALGQMQPISNTSGVALSIMYQPMMQRYNLKKLQYTVLIKRINELALRTLFTFEPDTVFYDPETDGIMEEGQAPQLDPLDPLVYQAQVEWAPPLPVDNLIKLQEIMQKMQLGLESKRGALKDLGNAFPDEKMQEIFEELVKDSKMEAALQMLKAQTQSAILAVTGMQVAPDGSMIPPMAGQTDKDGKPVQETGGPPSDTTAPSFHAMNPAEMQQSINDLVTQAYGTKLGQRRNPDNE
jgi:Phage portal protein, SPP1 Gp6-like